jgi:hypothetical protein
MAGTQTNARGARPAKVGWVDRRLAEAEQALRNAEAMRRRGLATVVNTAEKITAASPLELYAMGRAALGMPGPPSRPAVPATKARALAPVGDPPPVGATTGPRQQRPRQEPSFDLHELGEQAGAFGNGLQDAFTFGAGDRVVAGAQALFDRNSDETLGERYRAGMEDAAATDLRDRQEHPGARIAGQVAGTVAQIAAMGPVGAAGTTLLRTGLAATKLPALARLGVAAANKGRMEPATRLVAREILGIPAIGAAHGVGAQAVTDAVTGDMGSVGDYAGAAVGGAIDAGATILLGPIAGGAVGGATTSAAQDLANLREISIGDARHAATGGAAGGTLGKALARTHVDGLNGMRKEELGERGSMARTRLRGDETRTRVKTGERLPSGGITKPDQRTVQGELVEAKFGHAARLYPRQEEAVEAFDNYRVDHFLPEDVEKLGGYFGGLLGMHLPHRQDRSNTSHPIRGLRASTSH